MGRHVTSCLLFLKRDLNPEDLKPRRIDKQ